MTADDWLTLAILALIVLPAIQEVRMVRRRERAAIAYRQRVKERLERRELDAAYRIHLIRAGRPYNWQQRHPLGDALLAAQVGLRIVKGGAA